HWHDVSPRAYNSPRRIVAATQTRERIVAAAAAILGTAEGISGFSLQAVADKAGVTRLTVYNQFGSRKAVLEAGFDDLAGPGRRAASHTRRHGRFRSAGRIAASHCHLLRLLELRLRCAGSLARRRRKRSGIWGECARAQ